MANNSVVIIENSDEEEMETVRLPESLTSGGNMDHNWKIFKEEFQIYLTASEKNKKSKEVKAAILLNVIGVYGRQLHRNFNMTAEDSKDIDKLMDEFDKFCSPKKNIVFEPFKFNRRIQQEGETFDNFLTAIQTLIRTCEYDEEEKNALRDQIAIGISDFKTQEKLLATVDVDSEKAIGICRAAELAKTQSNFIQKEEAGKIDIVQSTSEGRCKRCSYKHEPRKCPAFGKKCNNCSKMNHFSSCCKVKSSITSVGLSDNYEDDSLYIG